MVADGEDLQPVGRHRHGMLSRSKTRASDRVGNVVVLTKGVVDAVLSAARSAPLKPQKLLPHPAMIE